MLKTTCLLSIGWFKQHDCRSCEKGEIYTIANDANIVRPSSKCWAHHWLSPLERPRPAPGSCGPLLGRWSRVTPSSRLAARAHSAHSSCEHGYTRYLVRLASASASRQCLKLILAFSSTDLATSQLRCSQPSCLVFFPRKCGGVSRDGDVCR